MNEKPSPMKTNPFLLFLGLALLASCSPSRPAADVTQLKEEIRQIEKAFMDQLNAEGAATAFAGFAAEDAVIKRDNDTLILGREAIRSFYSAPVYQKASATWAPDFIDVSADGSMAYTYGKYQWIITDSNETRDTFQGVFHTVWKKMASGEWKYVWD